MTVSEKVFENKGKQKLDGLIYCSLVNSFIYPNNNWSAAYAINIISQFASEQSKAHFIVAMRILRYTCFKKLWYSPLKTVKYMDNEQDNFIVDRKSTSCQML